MKIVEILIVSDKIFPPKPTKTATIANVYRMEILIARMGRILDFYTESNPKEKRSESTDV